MESTVKGQRPGGRTADTSRRIFDAVLELLMKGGLAACTFQAVAAHSGVGRTTLYRRWPDRAAMALDALADRLNGVIATPDAGSLADDLRLLLTQTSAFLVTPLGRAALSAAAEGGASGVARTSFWQRRLAAVEPILIRAQARGELGDAVDRELVLASAVGAIYFRLLVAGQLPDEAWIERIIDHMGAATTVRS